MPGILSGAGMHKAVLACPDCSPVQRVKALFFLGEWEECLALVRCRPEWATQAGIWGALAYAMPDVVFSMKDAPLPVKQWCEMELNHIPLSPSVSENIFFQWKEAAQCYNFDKIIYLLTKIYNNFNLGNVNFEYKNGILFNRCKEDNIPVEGPLVSIIMTAYNEEKYISMSIDSVIQQSYKNIELIIIDDASTDKTLSIARDKSEQDSRIKVFSMPCNSGTWVSKNVGLEHASGDFVMMHDADDWSHPDKVRLMMKQFQHKGIQSVSSRIIRIHGNTWEPFSRDISNFIRWNPSSFMYRRSFVKEHGNYLDLLGSDCEIVARHEMISGVSSHVRLPLPLSLGFSKKDSLSSKFRGNCGGLHRMEDWERWRFMHVEYLKNNKSML